MNLHLDQATEISTSKILIDYKTGEFIDRGQIVRVDKVKKQIQLRNGKTLPLGNLKKGILRDVVGLQMA
jgi:hypothetical protein